jgi:hypothetical protein
VPRPIWIPLWRTATARSTSSECDGRSTTTGLVRSTSRRGPTRCSGRCPRTSCRFSAQPGKSPSGKAFCQRYSDPTDFQHWFLDPEKAAAYSRASEHTAEQPRHAPGFCGPLTTEWARATDRGVPTRRSLGSAGGRRSSAVPGFALVSIRLDLSHGELSGTGLLIHWREICLDNLLEIRTAVKMEKRPAGLYRCPIGNVDPRSGPAVLK